MKQIIEAEDLGITLVKFNFTDKEKEDIVNSGQLNIYIWTEGKPLMRMEIGSTREMYFIVKTKNHPDYKEGEVVIMQSKEEISKDSNFKDLLEAISKLEGISKNT